MNAVLLLAVAGATTVVARVASLTVATRLPSTERTKRLSRQLVACTTAAIGAPAVLSLAGGGTGEPVAVLVAAACGTGLAARGRPLLVALVAAIGVHAAVLLALTV